MAEGFALADAFVRIRPDAGGFRAEATSQVKSALSGIKPEIKIGADFNPAKASVAAFNAYARAALKDQTIDIGAETAAAKARVAALAAQLAALTRKAFAARLVVDDAGMQAKLGAIMTQLRAIDKTIEIGITEEGAEQVQTKLLSLSALMTRLSTEIADVHVDINDADAMQRLALLTTQLTALTAQARNIRLGLTDEGAIAELDTFITRIGALTDKVSTLDFKTVGLGDVSKAEEDFKALNEEMGQAFPLAVARASQSWLGWGALTNKITLFGGLTSGIAGFGATITAWHLLADAIIEVAAVLIPAGIAFGAFAAAAGPATETVVNHMKAVLTVTQATAQAVAPFTNAFRALSTAITPHVYELFGQVMTLVNSRMGEFATLATRAVGVVDMFGARIERAIASSGFQKFLANAITDLTTVGDIIGNVFGIIGNLIKMVFGVAQVLFHAILDITGAIERLTSLPLVQTLGRWALGMHGFWIWTGLAISGIVGLIPLLARLTGGLSESAAAASGIERVRLATADLAGNVGAAGIRISNIIPAIKSWAARMAEVGGAEEGASLGSRLLATGLGALKSVNPWVWVGVGVVALTALSFWLLQTKSRTEQWISSLQASLDKTITWTNAITVASSTLAKVNMALQQTAASAASATTYTGAYGIRIGEVGQNLAAQVQKQNDLTAAQKTFGDEANIIAFRLGTMASRFGGLTNAMGLARLAGIKVTDLIHAQGSAWANDLQQIEGLVRGYQYMGVASGALGNDVKALQVTTDDQIAAVQQLNQAWTTMLGIVAGGETNFVSFAQQMLSVKQATSGLANALTTTNGVATSTLAASTTGLTTTARAANAASTNINGLNQSSLQLRQTWGQAIAQAQTYYEALQTQAAAATDAARGSSLLQQAGEDILRILAPAARGSATLRQEIFLLAQQFGFTKNQMEQFIHNTGSVKANEKDLEGINNQLARSVSNVGRDWANMATTLNGQVKSALNGAALASSGAKYAAEQLYRSIHAGIPNLSTEHDWFQKLVTDLVNSGLTYTQAKDEAEAYTKGLHANWQEIAAGRGPRSLLITDTLSTLGVTKNLTIAMSTLTTELKHTSDTTAAGRATRLQLINDIYQTGIQAGLSTRQIQNLISEILKIPKSEALQLIMKGTGTFSISQIGSLSKPGGKLSGPGGTPGAAGMRVPGSGNRDSFPAMLTPGEAVVPRHLVPAVAPFLGAHKVPGFAAGGFVGTGTFAQIAPEMSSWVMGDYTAFKANMTDSMVTAMRAAIKSAQAAAVAALAFQPGGSRFGGSAAAEAFARALLPSYGWANQWGALFQLWQRESGWNPYAVNPSSGAYGIPQSLGHGHPYALGDYANQIRWGLAYIRSRYGSPDAAWGHELNFGWYDQGGWLPPGMSLALNTTGRPEPVGSAGGMTVNVNVKIDPAFGPVIPNPAVGQQLGQHISAAIKRGLKLYPVGMTPA